MFWNKKRKQEQQKWELLRQLFLEMIESTNGSINSIQFASYVNRKSKITLSGHECTRFLETMVEEFQGIYEPTPEGYMNYRFHCKATPQNQQSTVSYSKPASPPQSSKSTQYHRSSKRPAAYSNSSSKQTQPDKSPRPSEPLKGKIKEFEGQCEATPQNQQSTVSSSKSASPPQSSKSTHSKSSSKQTQPDKSPYPLEPLEGKIKEFEGQLQNLFGNLFDGIGR